MLVMSPVKKQYNSINVKARRLIKKKYICVCTFERLKKKNQDLSCLKRNVIFLCEWCGPEELINLASPFPVLKCCEDSKSPKRLLAQVILKANCENGFCFQTVSSRFDKILRKELAHSMLHILTESVWDLVSFAHSSPYSTVLCTCS